MTEPSSLDTPQGRLRFQREDYVFVPRSLPHRWRLNEPATMLIMEGKSYIDVPAQFRVPGGQLDMGAPYSHRDFREPEWPEGGAASLDGADLAGATAADHFRYFATFVATLLADFAAYREHGEPDLVADRVGYRQVPVWLTDEEFDEMAAEMSRAVQRRFGNEPSTGRRRRVISTVVMPGGPR